VAVNYTTHLKITHVHVSTKLILLHVEPQASSRIHFWPQNRPPTKATGRNYAFFLRCWCLYFSYLPHFWGRFCCFSNI